jgi:hypothetical protein
MTQALAVNDIVKIQLWSHDAEQAAVNTFHFKVTAVGGLIASLEDMIKDIDDTVEALYKAILNQQATYDGILGQIVFPPPLMVHVVRTTNAGAGTGGAQGAARQVAGLLRWGTPLAGPGGRGRNYLPFTSNADSDGIGVPTAGYGANATAFAVALSSFTTVSEGGRTATVAFGLKKRNSSTFTAITSGNFEQKWATQKKRGSFGRPNSSPF